MLERLQVLQIADVLTQEGVAVTCQAERVLELRAAGEDLGERPRQRHRERGVTPRPPQKPRPSCAHQPDRVVVAHGDLAIVHEIGVRHHGQPVDLLPALHDRLFREVAARHHQRPPSLTQEQDVQRRVRQHRPEVPLPHGDLGVDGESAGCRRRRGASRPAALPRLRTGRAVRMHVPPLKQHDGVFGRGQQLDLAVVHPAVTAQLLEAVEHHGKRLVGPPFAVLEPQDRSAIGRVARQMEAAEALHRQDLAAPQQLRRSTYRPGRVIDSAHRQLLDRAVRPAHQAHARAAHRAGVGLGMEAPVRGIFVLAPASGAQREGTHGRALAVVGQVLDDREARATVRAVGEGIVVAAIGRIEQLGAAVSAGRDVRRDQLIGAGLDSAVRDHEDLVVFALRGRTRQLGDEGARRRLRRQRCDKGVYCGGRAFNVDLHSRRRVAHPAGDAVAFAPVHRRTA